MRHFFILLSLIAALAFAAVPARAETLRFPQTGAHAFQVHLPQGWKSTTDKRGGLLLVPPDNHALIYLAILKDDKLRGAPESTVAGQVAKIAGIVMDDKQDPERMAGPNGAVLYRGMAFHGIMPAKHGLARRAKIVLFRLAPNTWAQVWTVQQPGMNAIETATLEKVLNDLTLTSK
jgi:hypothetical protein